MELPLISVLIPTYNVEGFVEEAINSILHQTYQNLEIIIVDDCSTDKTYAILERLAKEDNRIRLFRNEVNKRIVDTLNFALTQARGSFIARMDGDDVSLPHRLESQYAYLLSNPSIDLAGLSYIIIDEEGNEIKKEKHLTDFKKIKAATRYVSPIPHFWLTRKAVYDTVGPYRIPGVEDYDFILRAIDFGYKVSNAPDFLYLHRIRPGNTATSTGLMQKKSFYYVKHLRKERKLHPDQKDSFSKEQLNKRLRSSRFEVRAYQISCRFHYQFIVNKKSKALSLAYLLLAILFSPKYLLAEKYNRFRYRRILYSN